MIKEMQKKFYLNYTRYSPRYEMLAPNVYIKTNEMDLFGLRKSGFVDEIEIKLSRSDFLADFKKTTHAKDPNGKYSWSFIERFKHECLAEGLSPCNYFSFFMPEEISEKCDIPEYAGLYTFDGTWLKEVKKAPRLHSRKISLDLKYKIARKMAYRYWENII